MPKVETAPVAEIGTTSEQLINSRRCTCPKNKCA